MYQSFLITEYRTFMPKSSRFSYLLCLVSLSFFVPHNHLHHILQEEKQIHTRNDRQTLPQVAVIPVLAKTKCLQPIKLEITMLIMIISLGFVLKVVWTKPPQKPNPSVKISDQLLYMVSG